MTTLATHLEGIGSGGVGPGGWLDLAGCGGSPHAGVSPSPHEVIAVLAHLSDLHVCDAESPARQEYLDHHAHQGAPFQRMLGDVGTYRPQEIFTVPVAVAMVEAVNRLRVGPVTGEPIDATVLTGDLVDNAQANELDWYLAVVGGGVVRPASGDPDHSGWVGAPDAPWSEHYWHPEGHRSGALDRWVAVHGFPTADGVVHHARAEVRSPGLQTPAFGVHGNHDALLQGTVAPDDSLRALAVGPVRYTDLAPGQSPLVVLEAVPRTGPARYTYTPASPACSVAPDRRRRLLAPGEVAARGALHAGPDHEPGPGNAYTAPLTAAVRLVALDTVNPHGGWEGSIDRSQLEWLRAVLARCAEQYLVVASHHPSWCLVNGWRPPGADDRVLADEVVGVLTAEPRVLVWLAGHVHHHAVVQHDRPGGGVLVEITSASLIDWPQQARVLELVRERGGTVALVSTAVDHAAPPRPAAAEPGDPLHLAALSRVLARNAPLVRDSITRAETGGRPTWCLPHNVVLRVADPAV
ncbi:MAG: metallophosphoesterase [Acidimicrobiales bacterium]|nr:metallophosphoesterase [Acidimicrobiales bacterium]